MRKETRQSIKEIATVTAVGAAEGAAIGLATGVGFLSLPGYAAGGIIGGVTALTTELIGRRKQVDLTVTYAVTRDPAPSPDQAMVTKTVNFKGVPIIQDADKVLSAVIPDMLFAIDPIYTTRQVSLDVEETSKDRDGFTHATRNGFTITVPETNARKQMKAKTSL